MTKEYILEVFKNINLMYNNPNMYDSLERMLDELIEEIEEKPKWIQCSELLPEYNQRVLVLEDTGYVFIAKRVKAEDNRLKEESWLDDDGYPFAFSNCHIIKWMPLPEGYKKGGGSE